MCETILSEDEFMDIPGPKYGKVEFDGFKSIPWDFKAHSIPPSLVAMVQIPIIGKYKRRLTVREAARLQDFPESFIPNENDQQAYKQFGNAVNVEVIKRSAESLFNYKDKATNSTPRTLVKNPDESITEISENSMLDTSDETSEKITVTTLDKYFTK